MRSSAAKAISMRALKLSASVLSLCVATGVAAQAPPPEFGQAVQKFTAQDFAGAIEILRGVTTSSPTFPAGWILLGRSYLGAGQTDPAREAFETARTFPAFVGQADYFDGLALATSGDLDGAFAALDRAKRSGQVNVTNVGLTPQAAALRQDPRYRQLFPSPEEYAAPFVEDVEVIHDWVGEAAGDQFGWIARNIGDVDGDGVMDVVTSAPTWQTNRGRVYIYSGGTGELLWTADGEAGDQLGMAIDEAGDVDGDGIGDVVAGAPNGGKAHVWSGRDGRLIHTFTDQPGISFGGGVSGVGDPNGDGHGDVLIGIGGANGGAGAARVYSGADGSVIWEHSGAAGTSFGSTVGGWVHGGDPLLVIGAPGAGAGQGGVTYVFRGLEHTPAFEIEAESSGAQNGAMFVSVLGDVDGDGMPDVYSSDWADGALGGSTGRIYVHSGATGARMYSVGGETAGDGFGIGVADAGDVDGDGLADLVVGAWQHRSAAISGGKVYVYSGRTAELLYTITGDVPGETFGFDTTGLGDVNGDGITDFLVTSAWSGINGTRSGRTLVVAGRQVGPPRSEPIELSAADGVTVFGDLYRPDGEPRGTILLFHQGGSNARAEYGPLAPRLLDAGYLLVTIDQRAGGSMLGGRNRTADAVGGDPHYCQAYPDLLAALEHAESLGSGRPILWGSSYSGALALKLASEHPERVAGVLAFSPAQGEAMGACGADAFVADVDVPVLAVRPAREMEIPAVSAALERFEALGHATYVSDPGVHGSSMLNPARVEGGVAETWAVVMEFLAGLNPGS